MKLNDLMKNIDHRNLADLKIGKVTSDSRKIRKGDIFVAIKGQHFDGHDYIDEVIGKGASIIVVDKDHHKQYDQDIIVVQSENSRKSLAQLAGLMWNNIPDICLGVTGTNGKSSVAGFVAQIMDHYCKPTLLLGTLGVFFKGQRVADSLTTPDPIQLHKTLEWAKGQGAQAISLEASSHGLEQYRLDSISFDVAAFTNLSRDHLDYHGTMQDYLDAKMRLFRHLLKQDGIGVVNVDDKVSEEILRILKYRSISTVTYGKNAALSICDIKALPQGQGVVFDHMGEKFELTLPLIGRFQVENAACAALMAMSAGVGTQAFEVLTSLKGIAGRVEYIGQTAKGGHIYVDYAHTPAGLKILLEHMRPHTDNRLAVLFGAGGDRDAGKRSLMGKAAHDYSDIVYITDDNPRTENAALIRAEIAKGAPEAILIEGRRTAIEHAIEDLNQGDILVVAGKGHENMQIIGTESFNFNDADIIRELIG